MTSIAKVVLNSAVFRESFGRFKPFPSPIPFHFDLETNFLGNFSCSRSLRAWK
jgi:hypothetical protein